MKKLHKFFAALLTGPNRPTLAIRILGLMLAAILWPAANAEAAIYSFTIGPPCTSLNPASGQTIRLTGGGSFDTTLGTVVSNGTYSIVDSDGTVVERGTWAGTSFGDFDALGGPAPGEQGGVLTITVTLFPRDGSPRANMPMTVICPFEADEGIFDEADDAALVGDFAVPTGGLAVFHLLAP